jgi:hypothetical protein
MTKKDREAKWREANRDHLRAYQREYQAKNVERIKEKVAKIGRARYAQLKQVKDGVKLYYGCTNPKCLHGRNLPAYCYDYHHLSDKEFGIGGGTVKLARVINEINKCTVLCVVCHRLATHGDLDATNFRPCSIDSDGIPLP